MTLLQKLKAPLRRFKGDESGNIAVETVLMVPLMAWAMMATLTFFDAYRTEGIGNKATLTIADMVSREADTINDNYIDGAQELLEFLIINDPSPELRITAFKFDQAGNKYEVVWSKTRGSQPELNTAALAGMTARLPIMYDQERMLFIETWTDYEPPWNVGIGSFGRYAYNAISSRFVTQLCFSNTPQSTGTLLC